MLLSTPVILITLSIVFSIFTAIWPFKIGRLPVTMATAPLACLALLFAGGMITTTTLKFGLFGNGQLVPWEIIVIFFTVAYVSISADITGIFDYFAYKIIHATRQSGIKLFIFFYFFACVLTVFTSNDIVILTLTPIIFYLSNHAKINIIPLLFAEYFGANTASMLLYIGNPTNIIVGNAIGLGFLDYSKVMWMPTLVAIIATLVLLLLVFRKKMTRTFSLHDGSSANVDNWANALISVGVLLVMLMVLMASDYINVAIWIITLIFCVIMIVKDWSFGMALKKPLFQISLKKIPWEILPFVFAFFIFMQGLTQHGVVDQIAALISSYSTTLGRAIAINGFLGLILANLLNNQPMSIFMSSILVSKSFAVSDTLFQASAYAIIIASNLGANLTLIGALAGLMWTKILKEKNLVVSYTDFLKIGLLIIPTVFSLTLIALYFVLR